MSSDINWQPSYLFVCVCVCVNFNIIFLSSQIRTLKKKSLSLFYFVYICFLPLFISFLFFFFVVFFVNNNAIKIFFLLLLFFSRWIDEFFFLIYFQFCSSLSFKLEKETHKFILEIWSNRNILAKIEMLLKKKKSRRQTELKTKITKIYLPLVLMVGLKRIPR